MRKRWWLGCAILLVTALPVLLLSPFPTQDGPAHLYAGHLLRRLGDPRYPAITRTFEYSPSALSTWTVHGMVSLLLGVVPPPWVEKLIILLFIGWLSALFISARDDEETLFFPACALPLFIMSFVLRMGFFSFCLSMPLAIHAVSLWTEGSARSTNRRAFLAACLLALLPLLHVLTAGWALLLMGTATIGAAVTRPRASMHELGVLALASLPLLAVLATYPGSSTPYQWEPIGPRLAALLAGGAFAGEGTYALWWSSVPSLALLTLGVLFLRDEVHSNLSMTPAALRRVLALVAAFALALLAPEEGAGGAYIGVRCNLLFFLLLLFLLRTWRLPQRADAVLSLVFLAFSVAHLSRTYTALMPASATEREIMASASLLQDHKTALVVVVGEWVRDAKPTLATQVRPLLHVGDLLGMRADRTILTFYEAELRLFPITFKPEASPFGVLFDRALFGWEPPNVRWDAVPVWRGGVDYVGVWAEKYLLSLPSEGVRFRNTICDHYEEVYRSDSRPWVVYQLRRDRGGASRTPRICPLPEAGR
jgi:hypothetical protein